MKKTLELRHEGTQAAALLYALAAAPGGVLPTDELTHITIKPGHWPNPATVHQRALSRAATVLRELVKSGHVERAGKVPGHWQQPPVQKWGITAYGREQLEWWAGRPRREAQWAIEAKERAARKTSQEIALEEARARYAGRRVPLDERIRVSQELRNAGCTLQAIADVFGVTRERVRQYVTPGFKRQPLIPRRQPKPKYPKGRVTMTGRQGRWPKQISSMNKDGPMAGLFTVTFTEW